jgi:peptidoglycan/xylan/chitin deacetylase (PgdA/CDA1 family)
LDGGSVTPTPAARQPGLARRLLLRLIGADTVAPAVRALGRGLLSIFTLHRFTDPQHEVEGTDPATLRDHLAYLRRHNYRLLSLTAALRLLEDGDAGWRTPAVAFTVDDGYADFATIAAPIFAEFDCPVTLFVTTGFLDGQLWLWWDRVAYVFQQTLQTSVLLRVGPEVLSYRWSTPSERVAVQQDVIERLQMVPVSEREAVITSLTHQLDVELPARPPSWFAPISWDDVRRTARLGATFGPHTVTHPILALTNDATCNWEIQESYRRVRQETDACVPVFCYPNGKPHAYRQHVLQVAERAGIKAALTTVPGYVDLHRVPAPETFGRFALPRFPYPSDRGHLAHVVAGMARLRTAVRHGTYPRPPEVLPLSHPCPESAGD